MSQSGVYDIQKFVQLLEEAISQEVRDADRILAYLRECRQYGLDVLPVDLNRSGAVCTVEDPEHLRLGFSVVVSGQPQFIEDLLAERHQRGPFRSFQDFCERIDCDALSDTFLTQGIQAGVFDAVEPSRARLLAGWKPIAQAVRNARAEQESGQFSLFAALPKKSQPAGLKLPDIADWSEEEKIAREQEAMGFSFTDYLAESPTSSEILDEEINSLGEAEAFPSWEGQGVGNTASVPSETPQPTPIPSQEGNQPTSATVLAEEEAEPVSAPPQPPLTLILRVALSQMTEARLYQLRDLLERTPGETPVVLELLDDANAVTHVATHADYCVRLSEELTQGIEALLGAQTTRVQPVVLSIGQP